MSECQTLNMSDSEQSDVTWEEFFGTTTDLMPTLLGMYDAFFDNNKNITTDGQQQQQKITHSHPTKPVLNVKKSGHFTNLSPTVQKMLANISNQNENSEIVNSVGSEDSAKPRKNNSVRTSKYFENYGTYTTNRIHKISQYSSEQRNSLMLGHMNKSSECLATICDNATSNVQKMLSNIPDQDLIISNCADSVKKLTGSNEVLSENTCKYSKSFSHTNRANNKTTDNRKLQRGNSEVNHSFLYKVSNQNVSDSGDNLCEIEITNVSDSVNIINSGYNEDTSCGVTECNKSTPLSPKLSSNRSNYLQVKDGTVVGGKENEKEVSRPVSLSSLGSCSSSGSSSGANQPSSIYLASTESLDSDPEPTGSQASADSGIAENPVMSPEQRVLQEILDTENVYVTDLKQVVEGYLQMWRETPDCPLTENLPDLFSNIEEIYEFNRKFLDELYESGNDLTFVSNAFIQNDSGFRIYTEYCTHYPRIMAVLTELTQDLTKAQLIRERQVALGHALPLGSYLLKPVQRILKYHLLLHRLSKLCDPAQQESIDMALMTMTSIAGHINHMKGKHEHAVRVQEIQSQLYGWTGTDLTAMGELCAEGTFKVGGARGFRHVYLFDKVLLITKNKSDGVLAYKSHIMCSNLMLVESVRGEPLSFHVIPFDNPRLQVTLRAKSLEHKREWTLQLKRVILENYNAVIPSHARQLVMQLGQEVKIPDDISTVDKWTPLKQYSAPEYLERRSRVRKSRDLSDRRAASHDRAFASLAAWRRKSEPNVAHYNTKTLPKKISKLKKARDRGAKFYTDLSDSEACDVISESNDSLIETKCQEAEDNETTLASNTLEQVVSQLLMQNQEFHRILNRQRKLIKDESTGVWLKQNVTDKPKSDSLPRSFQLNEEVSVKEPEKKPVREEVEEEKLEESVTSNTSNTSEVNEEEDDEDMYPDHRIYRKSTIRFSLVQRFRAMISEESQRENKLPTYKQGSELMGAKIAQPDYADPQKLFSTVSSISGSQFSLDADSVKLDSESLYEEIKSETKQKTNCTETKNAKFEQIDTGQCNNYLSPILNKRFFCDKSIFNSSQSNDCVQKSIIVENQSSKLNCATKSSFDSCNSSDSGYYEKLLEQNLHNNEEDPNRRLFRSFRESNKLSSVRECSYESAKNNRNSLESRSNSVVSSNRLNMSDITESVHAAERLSRCDELPHQFPKNISFSEIQQHSSQLKSHSQSSKFIKRPLKPPPPVPAKPTRVSSLMQSSSSTVVPTVTTDDTPVAPTKGWVKTVVGRFE